MLPTTPLYPSLHSFPAVINVINTLSTLDTRRTDYTEHREEKDNDGIDDVYMPEGLWEIFPSPTFPSSACLRFTHTILQDEIYF